MMAAQGNNKKFSFFLPGIKTCLITFIAGFALLHMHLAYADPFIGPGDVLFGSDVINSLAVAIIVAGVLGLCINFLRHGQTDHFTSVAFFISALLSLHSFWNSGYLPNTPDWQSHFLYIRYLEEHWLKPFDYTGPQRHHPALYYYTAATILSLLDYLHTIPSLTALRFLSWCYFQLFTIYSLFTLRRAGFDRAIYYLCVVLLVFWPSQMHLPYKLSNESFYYACYAATFYYALCWYQTSQEHMLRTAVILAGISLLARSNAVVLFVIIGIFMCVARARGRFSFSELYTKFWLITALFLMECMVMNYGTLFSQKFMAENIGGHWGYGVYTPFSWSHYFFINPWYVWTHPYNDWSENMSFWDFLLKTSIFGQYNWPSPYLVIALSWMAYLITAYSLLGLTLSRREGFRQILPYITGIVVPIAFLIPYHMWKSALSNQDARLIYPLLPAFIICFGFSCAVFKKHNNVLLQRAGYVLTGMFSITSIWFFWIQKS